MSSNNVPFSGIYIYGMDDGKHVKIGQTATPLEARRRSLLAGQFHKVDLNLLVAVRSANRRADEKQIHNYFSEYRADVNSKETFHAERPLIEYVNWLREQHHTWTEETGGPDHLVDYEHWRPQPDRRVTIKPDTGELHLFSDAELETGSLAGTVWSYLAAPPPSYNGYYTAPDIVERARQAMGGIDLDPASSWRANQVLRIPEHFNLGRRAEDNKWTGRVWLNPPTGENRKWFELLANALDAGTVTQACLLVPGHALVAKTHSYLVWERATMTAMLCPTPLFWGRGSDRNKKDRYGKPIERICDADNPILGDDNPKHILYFGSRLNEFRHHFEPIANVQAITNTTNTWLRRVLQQAE